MRQENSWTCWNMRGKHTIILIQMMMWLHTADKANVYSAGVETHGVNPRAIQIMREDGIDISEHTSNNVLEYTAVPFDFVITVCDHAKEVCPYYPSNAQKFHYNFPDPTKVVGTEEEITRSFTEVREMIKKYCLQFVKENI